jgi:hypothetical protein
MKDEGGRRKDEGGRMKEEGETRRTSSVISVLSVVNGSPARSETKKRPIHHREHRDHRGFAVKSSFILPPSSFRIDARSTLT